jgi:hypothetical protein
MSRGGCLSNAHWLGPWRQHFDMNHGVAGLLESTFCVPYSVSELSGFPPQTSQACWRQPFYKGLLERFSKGRKDVKWRHTPRVYFRFESGTSCLYLWSKFLVFFATCIFLYRLQLFVQIYYTNRVFSEDYLWTFNKFFLNEKRLYSLVFEQVNYWRTCPYFSASQKFQDIFKT